MLTDAAIWYHRAQDLTPLVNGITDTAALEDALRESFIRDLGLTTEEIAAIFDANAHPLAGQDLQAVLSDQVADPQDYLPDLDAPGQAAGDLSGMLSAFAAQANDPAVGLRVSHPVLLRFMAALAAKPFLILGGLSGSGKTRLSQALAHWLTPAAED
ncbi:MAG TPA: hypothetical protein VES73_12385, partial [Lamprocystis sp. (in: g-proteobacteria)]|nr:hypothetical protein [Lamprocystis sp. (in: g-proteobacteria)]